jgi:DNA-binding PadR family transcriptional regulator
MIMKKEIISGKELTDNEYCVLNALASKPMYGYAIKKEVEQMTQGSKKLSLATLYDTLRKLLEDGLIARHEDFEVVDGRVRRSYQITGEGEHAIHEKYNSLKCLMSISRLNTAEGDA